MKVTSLTPAPKPPVGVFESRQLVKGPSGYGISIHDKHVMNGIGQFRIVGLNMSSTWSYDSWQQAAQSWKLADDGVTLENV